MGKMINKEGFSMGEQRQQYNEEFKRKTVNFIQQQKKTVKDIADDLKIPRSTLYEWIKEYREFDNEPAASEQRLQQMEKELREKERELKARERELEETKEELSIVKKAVHIFSRPRL
jgi:transposase